VDRQGIDLLTAPATSTKPLTIDDKALAAVDGEWRTAREIFAVVDEGAPVSVRHALVRLADAGLVDRRSDPHHSGEIARYRICGAA
jgi:hypothetical protein